jgi:hypothetical protein
VGHLAARLTKNEALIGIHEAEAAAAHIARQRQVVRVGVLAAERELEAAFAVAIAVAGALVAARPGKHGDDLPPE